jgi:hypothetical protein
MDYPKEPLVTSLSTGPDAKPYVVLRLVSNTPRGAPPLPAPKANKPLPGFPSPP